MILFKQEHVAPILAGTKTQTRRLGKKRWNVGSVHQCQTRMLDNASVFAHVRIVDVRQEHLRSITMADSIAEGYTGPGTYLDAFYRINRMAVDADPLVWVVKFKALPCIQCVYHGLIDCAVCPQKPSGWPLRGINRADCEVKG